MSNTLANLVLNEPNRRQAFPVVCKKLYFAHGSVTPFPAAVRTAMSTFIDGWANDPDYSKTLGMYAATRAAVARMVNCQAEEVALLGPTSMGLNMIAHGIDWQAGDEVICYGDDFPSNVYPWQDLARRGVVPRFIRTRQLGVIEIADIKTELTSATRLVSLSSAHYLAGYHLNVPEIGRYLSERGVLFALDAIQSLGVFPISLEDVDFIVAGSHKWLLGPMAAGVFVVKKERMQLCRPSILGAFNVSSPDLLPQPTIDFKNISTRYEAGMLNAIGIAGMRAGIELLQGIGVTRIHQRIAELRQLVVELLRERGFLVLCPECHQRCNGIVSATRIELDINAMHEYLTERDVACSVRKDRAGADHIRLCVNFYNTTEEISELGEIIDDFLRCCPPF